MNKYYTAFIILLFLFSCAPEAVKKEEIKEKSLPELSAAMIKSYVLRETINLRRQPNTQSPVVKQLTSGEPVYIFENRNGWYEVQTEDGQKGFIRSDLIGPRSLSYTTLASAFVDSVLPNFRAEMFFDKTDLYKTVYLTLQSEYYTSKKKANDFARKIGLVYQQKVYPGFVELRILKPDGKELFSKVQLKNIGMGDLTLPVLDFGRLIRVDNSAMEVALFIVVPDSINDRALLKSARKISSHFAYPVNKVEVVFAVDNPQDIALLQKLPEKQGAERKICRLYYLEDKDGEFYKFNACGE
ncbi:MAG TPA: SH3 domain-containing protein [Calditrichaeota bacterium]|nr:SH3 domain-containing protein [Calditrichota bacterium]